MRNNIKNIIYIRRILLVSLLFGMNCSFAMAHTLRVDTLLQNDINRVAYGIQPKWMTTGAVSSVKGNELKSFVPNIANMLNGQIPGLVVQQWGCEPGADSPAMNARGVNTYGSGTGLFIVIDGFQSTEAYFQQLTPQEIESITLLKDASATAIYGSKGANGVLLITTKRGTSDKIKINFSIQSGFQQPLRLPEFLGAYDYATLYNEALVNDGKSPFYTPMDLEAYKTGNDPIFHPDVDWYGTILRKAAPITNYNFTASGSNEYFRYFVLLNVLDDRSLYRKAGNVSDFSKNGTYTRYNFRTNIDVKLSKRLQGAVTLGGTIEDKTNPGTSENTSGMFDLMSSIAPNAFPVYVSTGMYGGNSMYSNPLGDLMQTGYTSYNGRSLQAIFQLKGDLGFITPGLSVNGAVGFNTYFKSYSKKSRQYARYSVDRDNADEIIYTTYGQNTSLAGDESSSSQWRDYSLQASLNYNRTFNGLHNIDAIYLGSYNDYVVTGTDLSYKNIAMGGRVTYSYDKRYIGEFSFGYNGTENFPKGHRFGFFPAGSLGWILSNEAFLKGNPILNYLKLRASYGIVGNDNIGGIRYTLNLQTHDFKWTSQITMSHYNAVWIERMPNYDYQKYQKRKNEPMNAFYYYKTTDIIDVDKSNMPESQRSLGPAACMPGYPIVEDKNGDGIIDVNDSYMDNMLPKLYFGFGNTFTWKNFDLDIFMYGQLGVKKWNDAYSYSADAGNLSRGVDAHNVGIYSYNIWNTQTNMNGHFPGIAISKSVALPENLGFDYTRENASYVRVRNITLGYNLGPKELSIFKGYIRGIRVFVDFQNPLTFTKYKGYDPEINTSSSNLTGGQYPQMRVYSIGAKLTF